MDPDANLEEQLELARYLTGPIEEPVDDHIAQAAYRLAELVEALDEWIRNGGSIPAAWRPDAAADIDTDDDYVDDPNDRPCSDPDGHTWGNTDDDGESGASYCIWCGVSGDV